MTFQGAELLQAHVMKEKKLLNRPFIPINGNAHDLKNFGGARIVYMWIKGAYVTLEDDMIELFCKDEHAMYLVTHVTTVDNRQLNTLRHVAEFKGKFASSENSMNIHIYAKDKINMSNDHIKEVNGEELSDRIAKG